MLAPLVIDLLYVCLLMLVSGWIYDILHASGDLSAGGTPTLAGCLSRKSAREAWPAVTGTSSHA